MSNLLVIPARFKSSRFPGKPLAFFEDFDGKKISLIEKTWKLALKLDTFDKKIIATDDVRIKEFCESFGAEVCMTSKNLNNGSERVAEALNFQDKNYEIIVNLQGDAPLTPIWVIEELVKKLQRRFMLVQIVMTLKILLIKWVSILLTAQIFYLKT